MTHDAGEARKHRFFNSRRDNDEATEAYASVAFCIKQKPLVDSLDKGLL